MTDAWLFLMLVSLVLVLGWITDHSILIALFIAALAAAFIWRRDRQR